MALDLRNGLGIRLVHFVGFRFVLRLFSLDVGGGDFPVIEKEISDFFARRRVVGDYFRNDILRARNCLVRRLDFFRYVFFRFPSYVQSFILREDGVRQRLKSLCDGDGSARFALLLIRAVNILHFGKRDGFFEGGLDLVRELSLFPDRGGNLLLPLFEVAEIGEAVGQRAQHLVVAAARHFLPVTGDKGNGVPLVDERKDIFRVRRIEVEFLGDRL